MIALATAARLAGAQSLQRGKDEPTDSSGQTVERNPLRGSTLTIDQSITTQTADIGETPQSYVPSYVWWLSLRPRWNFTNKLRVQARIDYFKELTNSEDTTYRDEDVFGDTWVDLVYSTPLATLGGWKNTRVNLAARTLWPTSKTSQGNGMYLSLGASAGVTHRILLHGDDAPSFNSARVGLTLSYLHAFTQSTTATPLGDGFHQERQPVQQDLPSFPDPQLSGAPLVHDTLYTVLDTGLQITPKLGLTFDVVWIYQWHYTATPVTDFVSTNRMNIPVGQGQAPDQPNTQLTWFIAALDYDLFEEMSVGFGYYNLSNVIAPDGTYRGPFYGGEDNLFWSPEAHFFVDATLNLDKIFEDATGRYKAQKPKVGQTSDAARDARIRRIANE